MPNRTAFYAQITPQHIHDIKAQGFATVINNRPDGEEPNQPTHEQIKQATLEAGLAYYFVPVVAGQMTQQDIETFAQIFNQAEKPVFMFCRSGNRSNILYHTAEQMDLLD